MPNFPTGQIVTDLGQRAANNKITNPGSRGEFQRYWSKATPTTQQPSVQEATDYSGQILAEAGQKIGNTVQDASAKWIEAQGTMQYETAKLNAETGFMDLLDQAENNEVDSNAFDKYQKQLSGITKSSLSGITSTPHKNRASLSVGFLETQAARKLNLIFKKKQIEYHRGEVIPKAVELFAKQKSMTPYGSPAWNKINSDFIESVNGWTSSGLISAEGRNTLIDEANNLQVMHEIAADDATETKASRVLSELQKKKGGRYDSLDPVQRGELIKKSLTQINQNKKFLVDQTVDNRLAVLKDFADGKIDWKNSGPLINQLTVQDPALGEAIKRGTDQLFIAAPDDEAFAEATQAVFSASSKQEISTYLMNVLNQNANKEISRDRLAILINAATERAQDLQTEASDPPATLSRKQIEVGAGVKSLLNSNPLFSTANMLVNYFKGINSGASPRVAHDEAVISEMNRTNPLSVKYKEGDIVTNPNGVSGEVVGFNENGSPIIRRRK